MPLDIKFEKTKSPRQKPDQSNLGFGHYFTDHMFVMNYEKARGWFDPRIVPYAPISLEPSAMVFHYAQEVFEGLKTYKTNDGRILLFRPNKNIERMNASNERLCMPEINADDFMQALKTLIEIEKDWIPTEEGTSLYIRPFIIATDPYIGVKPSDTYLFFIILSPVGAYYPEGVNP
jgi:branched-chain amino acid aminotransferase